MTDQRERFEAWALMRLSSIEYDTAYEAWQAATAADEADVEKTKAQRDHTRQWYGTRFETLWHWAHKRLPEDLRNEYFNIVANDTPTPQDPPTYAQQLNMAIYRAKRAEADKWAAVRRCVEIVRQWEYSAAYISDAIKAEFPEAFK